MPKKLSEDQVIKQEERELRIEYFIFVPILILIVVLISSALPSSSSKKVVELVPSGGSGYWLVYEDGSIENFGAAHSQESVYSASDDLIVAAQPAETGFWTMSQSGRIQPVGGSNYGGGLDSVYQQREAVAIAGQPNGRSYRIVTNEGEVYDFNTGPTAGQRTLSDIQAPEGTEVAAIVSSASGNGYWIVARDGNVYSFGDALKYEKIYLTNEYVVDADRSGDNLVVLTNRGRVLALGGATVYGGVESLNIKAPLVDVDVVGDGAGYLVTAQDGQVFGFGSAKTY